MENGISEALSPYVVRKRLWMSFHNIETSSQYEDWL